MDQRETNFFRHLLKQRMDELLFEAGRTVAGMDEKENFPDPTDRAVLEANRNFLLRIRDRERKLISKIQDALSRLDQGEYGVCEACGEKISIARLKVRPVTTFCIDCKSSQEVEEKKYKHLV